MGSKVKLSGKRIGRLLVLEYLGGSRWSCDCDCGTKTSVTTKNLNNGNTKSCGCLQKERASLSRRKHGMSRSPIYQIWRAMRARCADASNSNYKNYGGRGIKVCERWANSFENFYEDMGDQKVGLSIDRINTNGNYEKSNCRWATSEEQGNNKRCNSAVEYMGETKTITQWGRELGISVGTMRSRINSGMSVEKVMSSKNHSILLTDSQIDSIIDKFPNKNRLTGLTKLALELGVNKNTLRLRLQERLNK